MSNITEKELKFIFPESEVEIAGHTFTLRPFSFAETRIVVKKLSSVLHLLTSEITPQALAEIFDSSFEGVRDVIALALNVEAKLVEKFDQQSAMTAITEIVRVNKDFFSEQVESTLTRLVGHLGMSEKSPSEK